MVGERALRHLRDIDKVAYIRFASVYRQFDDIEEFQQELAQLERIGAEPLPGEEPLPGLDAGESLMDETIITTPHAVATQGRTGHD
jgi:transcriptional repressor NrdR